MVFVLLDGYRMFIQKKGVGGGAAVTKEVRKISRGKVYIVFILSRILRRFKVCLQFEVTIINVEVFLCFVTELVERIRDRTVSVPRSHCLRNPSFLKPTGGHNYLNRFPVPLSLSGDVLPLTWKCLWVVSEISFESYKLTPVSGMSPTLPKRFRRRPGLFSR